MGLFEALKFLIIMSFMTSTSGSLNIPVNIDCDKIRTNSEIVCTACNIYHEARGESFNGKVAVASVTRNRVDSSHFPDNFCDVVWERKQFSWTKDGRSDKIRNLQSWEEAYLIAYITVESYETGTMHLEDKTNGSLWYHANYVHPIWARNQNPIVEIEGHKFYTRVAMAVQKH